MIKARYRLSKKYRRARNFFLCEKSKRTLDLHTIGTVSSTTEDAMNAQFWQARTEIMSKHPAYGFYTQKTSEEVWKKIFEETTRPFVDQGRICTLYAF